GSIYNQKMALWAFRQKCRSRTGSCTGPRSRSVSAHRIHIWATGPPRHEVRVVSGGTDYFGDQGTKSRTRRYGSARAGLSRGPAEVNQSTGSYLQPRMITNRERGVAWSVMTSISNGYGGVGQDRADVGQEL